VDLLSLREFLARLQRGELDLEEALRTLSKLPAQRVADFAQLDAERAIRQGVPEVVFGERKTPDQIGKLVSRLRELGQAVLVTRLSPEGGQAAASAAPEGRYDPVSRTFHAKAPGPAREPEGVVAVVCAGTTDIPVGEEACVTAEFVGAAVTRHFDVGVSGIHRLLGRAPELREAHAIVVCAGMEGALPSVVAGLVPRPVIAVPTSVGYGAALGGLTALFAMLNSCAANVSVVNIDNGFSAGFQAALIARCAARGKGH